jgi:hypothetical protein
MIVGLCVCVFVAGYVTGDYLCERRWKRAAFEGLELVAEAIEKLRGARRT